LASDLIIGWGSKGLYFSDLGEGALGLGRKLQVATNFYFYFLKF
jgi:hypothetical protein